MLLRKHIKALPPHEPHISTKFASTRQKMQSGAALNSQNVADMAQAAGLLLRVTELYKLAITKEQNYGMRVSYRPCLRIIPRKDKVLESEEWKSLCGLVCKSDAPVRFVLHWALCKDIASTDENQVFEYGVQRTLYQEHNRLSMDEKQNFYRGYMQLDLIVYELALNHMFPCSFHVNINECKEAKLHIPALVDECIQGKIISTLEAFSMASHTRLGSSSPLHHIPNEMFPIIGSMLEDMMKDTFKKQEFAELLRLVE